MALDSEASFKSRCAACGLPEVAIEEMHAGGITTFAGLAFCTPHQANAGIDDAALMTHVNGLLTTPLTPSGVASLRRLAFEAQALALQDLKTKLERPSDTDTKVLPLQEKVARLARQRERLNGIVLTPHNTPSHALVDRACAQLEEGVLQWLHPSKCTSRHAEALAEKPKASLSFDSHGSIKVTSASHEKDCDTGSAHLLRVALQRRALAYDVANIITFDVMERWHQSLFDRLHYEPPPNYSAPGLAQLIAADKALWLLVSEDTRAKLTEMDPDSPHSRICDSYMNYYSDHPDVLFHLMITIPPRTDPLAELAEEVDGKTLVLCNKTTPRLRIAVTPSDYPRDFSSASLRKLFDLLPLEPPARGVGVGLSGSFTTGAYVYSNEVGLRRNLTGFPLTSSLLAAHVRRISPSFPFTTVALFHNLKTPCHQDNNNFPGSFNLVVPLTKFQHGEIWCEDPSGTVPQDFQGDPRHGVLLDVASGPVLLPAASCLHATCDWTGDRLVLVAFSVGPALQLPPDYARALNASGFTLAQSPDDLTSPVPLRPLSSTSVRPLMVEICSGSGVMAAAFRDLGFLTLAIDKPGNPHRLRHSYVPLDLSRQDQQQLLFSALDDAALIGVLHLGVPCGTCSRARERALPRRLQGRFRAPPPLRDARHPLGKPGLRGLDRDRVQTANEIYKLTIRLVLWAFHHDVPVVIENPSRSWLWPALEALVRLMSKDLGPDLRRAWQAICFYDLDACQFGGKRKKRTRLASTVDLSTLAQDCDGSHPHAPWSIREGSDRLLFDTAEEAQYPDGLCRAMAQVFDTRLRNMGLSSWTPPSHPPFGAGAATGSTPLIPQFREVLWASALPEGDQYKLLAFGHGGESQGLDKDKVDQIRYGVRWTPAEFLQQAKNTEHPMNPERSLSGLLRETLFHNLTMDPLVLAKSRIQAIITIKQMAQELEEKEAKFKSTLDPMVAKVLKPKRLLLWKALLLAADYDDLDIVDLVAKGIPLTGSHGAVPALPEKLVPATDTHESLLASSILRRKAIISRKSDTPESEQADLKQASDLEVQRGEVEGPFSEKEITDHFGSENWLLNPRFALYQGSHMKLRVIDDAKQSGLNAAFQRTCEASLMDLDALTCVLATIAKAMGEGSYQGSEVHPSVLAGDWLGRTLDLTRAYKQLAIDAESRRVCVLGFKNGDDWIYYRCHVLPFGARASVFSFLRVSRSLHFLMAKYLTALNTVFFDDYTMLTTSLGAPILLSSASCLLSLLGWAHAQEGEKAPGFASTFVALGVQISLQDIGRGTFTVQNKPGRVDKLVAMIEEAATNPRSGFFYNKGLRFLAKALNKAADNPGSQMFRGLCRVAVSLLRATPPRTFDMGIQGPPLLVFTDGAWESGRAGAGAVVHCCATGKTLACTIPVPQTLIDLWVREAGEQIICQIEMWAFLALRVAMKQNFQSTPVISWIDNEAARFALMKGTADSATLRSMARVSQHFELQSASLIWFERVASFSNPSDMPSRGHLAQACKDCGAEAFELPDVSHLTAMLLRLSREPWAEL
ncbi:unnamed protein product [Symbiodinium sp. CCMP2592]|nr:unnamed protein product [Symbiodinium sp. CCMP2592]